MAQYTLQFPQNKNGNGTHGRRERNLAADLKHWIADLDAAQELRREQLKKLTALRSDVYRSAKARGVTPAVLRATRRLVAAK
jgi:hypothetical protein